MIVLATSTISLGAGKSVRIKITGGVNNLQMKPVYIEWNGTILTIFPEELTLEASEIFPCGNSAAFSTFLDKMEDNREKEYIIAAIKPSGFYNFFMLRRCIVSRGIQIGYEPIDEDWELSVGRSKGAER